MKIYSVITLLAFTLLVNACTPARTISSSDNQGTAKPTKPTNKLKDNKTFKLKKISSDKTYGYDKLNPVLVGGMNNGEGIDNEQRFLNALAGPNGELISYSRNGSCCHFSTENGMMGVGLLDIYSIVWKGQKEPVIIYLNMYDGGELVAPLGLTIKGKNI